MERFTGIFGIILILGLAYLFSNNRKSINRRLVLSGLALQLLLALLVLKVDIIKQFFAWLGKGMEKIEGFGREGGKFVFGALADPGSLGKLEPTFGNGKGFLFFFNIPCTIILVCVLVAMLYHLGIMQRIVALISKGVYAIMRTSGAETLSNVASAFVGQVEAQVMIRPYLNGMTRSELLSSMSGSMACIAGGILIVYVNMGVEAPYLLAASIMAAPAALVISKIVFPETEESETKGMVKLQVKSNYNNLIDAISHGAADGMKISLNVVAMLIGFIGLIAFINYIIGKIAPGYSLDTLFGFIFYPMAWCMGVPEVDVQNVAALMGKKLTINEFVAYSDFIPMKEMMQAKSQAIASFALCGFANFASVGMQIGGIGELAPNRRADLAKLGLKALFCGTLASYLSACIAGILIG
ncbi:MAG: NupC/NupG family nucleoside CNT transporter [Flavobacteriaceae bacterium]|nr:NupC/NupG family nucleoside CNT transporter [Flavobacteriaceae bacterium]